MKMGWYSCRVDWLLGSKKSVLGVRVSARPGMDEISYGGLIGPLSLTGAREEDEWRPDGGRTKNTKNGRNSAGKCEVTTQAGYVGGEGQVSEVRVHDE